MNQIFDHYRRVDPIIFHELKDMDILPLTSKEESAYFSSLCQNIIGQQLSGKVADVIISRFENLLPDGVTPETVVALAHDDLRQVGLSNAKADYIDDLANKVQSKEVNLSGLNKMTNEQVISELIKVKGIGNWTAEMFLIFTLGREDVFSFGDLGLKNAFKKLYSVDDSILKDKMIAITALWAPYRSYGCLGLWHALSG